MAAKNKNPLTQDELVELLRAQAQRWLDWPNVTSVGVGPRLVNGQPTGELSIQVSVAEKIPDKKEIGRRGSMVLPRTLRAPDGRVAPVDVVERSFRLSYELVSGLSPFRSGEEMLPPRVRRRRRLTRLLPGVSISHPTVPAGTLGAIVYDQKLGWPCVLSNAHVLVGANGKPGDVTLQPGSSDSADLARNELGRLLRSHVGLAGDCAIASIENRLFDETIFELGVAPRRVAKVAVGDKVAKSGRTTGVTFGVVKRAGLVIRYDYGGATGKQDIGGFEIQADPAHPSSDGRLCDGGDSGAVWMIVENGQVTDVAAGLHFAQQTDTATGVDFALACNLHSVLEKLEVSFVRPA